MRASADGADRAEEPPVEPGSMIEVYPKAAAAAATAIVPAMTPVNAMLLIRLSFPEFEIDCPLMSKRQGGRCVLSGARMWQVSGSFVAERR